MLFLRRSDKHSVTLLKRQIFLCPRPYSWRTGTLGFMERLEIVHELTCINRNRRMLRQTLTSFESLNTMTAHDAPLSPNRHHCREQLRKQSCVTISVSVTVQIISPTSGCEKILWIKRDEGRAFQNRELAYNPALNLTIAHSNYKKYQKILLDRHAMSSASCSEGSAPNQTVSSFLPLTNYVKVKSPWNLFFSCAYPCF